jgi:hypothetical protein
MRSVPLCIVVPAHLPSTPNFASIDARVDTTDDHTKGWSATTTDTHRAARHQEGRALPQGRVHIGRPPAALQGAKLDCRRAHGVAKRAGGLSIDIADRIWADTLVMIEDKPVAMRIEMLARTQTLLELLADVAVLIDCFPYASQRIFWETKSGRNSI